MALKGDLASVDLAQVFQMLALNQKVGILGIQSPQAHKSLYFDPRGATLCFNEHTMLDRVLAQLIRTGVLMASAVEEARDHAARANQSVVDSLLAGGFLLERDLDRALRSELEEDIYEIFFWKDARFEFYEGSTTLQGLEFETIAERFFFNTDMLIMEAARRIDEWSYIQQRVSGALQVFQPCHVSAPITNLSGDALMVLELVDGKRNVARLTEISGLPKFILHKSLATLAERGLIEDVPPEDLLTSAQDCFHEGRLQDAINLFEKCIADGVGLPDAHILVAEAYEAVAEYELAAYHRKSLAEHRAEAGKVREAIDLLRAVLAKIPTDLAAWERLVELSVGHPELKSADFDPLDAGKRLVDLYLEIGEIERVRGILEGLLRSNPEDLELKKSLINVHSKAGDTRRVIELYESIADDLVRHRDPIAAVKFLQKIVMMDRSRKDISEKIRRLYQLDERRRSRRRSMAALGVILILLLVGGVGYVFYDQHARKAYEGIGLEPLKLAKDYSGAIRKIDGFLAKYPYTIVGGDIEAERENLARLLEIEKANQAARQAEVDAALAKVRNQYKLQWEQHQTEFSAGNLAGSLQALDKCRELVEKAGQPDDNRWALRVKLPHAYKELKTYLGQVASIERQARRARDAGDWKAERDHVLKLVTKYELADASRRAQIPVLVATRPAGAMVRLGDQLLKVKTPAIVYCPNVEAAVLTLELDGFEPRPITVRPREKESVLHVLTIRPSLDIAFTKPAQTAVGVSGNRLVVGLRGGEVGMVTLDGAEKLQFPLRGLTEIVGEPAVAGDHCVFQTNEGELRAHGFARGERLWSLKPEHALAFEPVVSSGRVVLVDSEARLICLRASGGGRLWLRALGGRAGGPPTVHGRKIYVGLQAGGVQVIDAANGDVLRSFATAHGVTTPVLVANRLMLFGTTDGQVQAIREDNGRVEWSYSAGRAVRAEEFVVSADGKDLFLMARDDFLVQVRTATGAAADRQQLPGALRFGLRSAGSLVYAVVRERVHADRKDHRDRLLAFDATAGLTHAFDFVDPGQAEFGGGPVVDGRSLYLVGSTGRVHRIHYP